MRDKQYETTKDRIQTVFHSLRDALNLGGVRWELHYLDQVGAHDHGDGSASLVEIQPSWQYGAATVMLYVPLFEGLDDDEIADALLHEFAHYWLHPISRYGSSPEYDMLEERVCTEIARAISTAIRTTGEEVADHWRLKLKRAEKDLQALQKQGGVA